MTPDTWTAKLEAENAALWEQVRELPVLREQIMALAARVQEVEARLAKDSRTNGKPPSSDALRRNPKSLRQRSGKRPGGQLGHRRETLHLVATPNVVSEHRSPACAHCQVTLDGAPVVLQHRRQVWELPPVRLQVTEHRALHLCRPAVTVQAEVQSRRSLGVGRLIPISVRYLSFPDSPSLMNWGSGPAFLQLSSRFWYQRPSENA